MAFWPRQSSSYATGSVCRRPGTPGPSGSMPAACPLTVTAEAPQEPFAALPRRPVPARPRAPGLLIPLPAAAPPPPAPSDKTAAHYSRRGGPMSLFRKPTLTSSGPDRPFLCTLDALFRPGVCRVQRCRRLTLNRSLCIKMPLDSTRSIVSAVP